MVDYVIDIVIDIDSYSNIFVKYIRTILLIELVLNFLFKAIIE
jgi:hypothetical protein